MNYYNPFQTLRLEVPEIHREDIERYCQTQPGGGRSPSPDRAPFARYVDMWFLAFCLGVRKGKPVEGGRRHTFIGGDILIRDPVRIELIQLVAIAHTKDALVVGEPGKMMNLANDFAAAGISEVLSLLDEGHAVPLWNLTEGLVGILETSTKAA